MIGDLKPLHDYILAIEKELAAGNATKTKARILAVLYTEQNSPHSKTTRLNKSLDC